MNALRNKPWVIAAAVAVAIGVQLTQGAIVVEWVGPEGTPTLDTDYSVSGNNITLLSVESDGDHVDTWRIGCDSAGCDIGSVTTNWGAGTADDVIVEVGTLTGYEVDDLTSIDIAAQSSAVYSNIMLTLNGSITTGPVKCYEAASGASAGAGGRLSGIVEGHAHNIDVNAIGSGSSTPGGFDVGEFFGDPDSTVRIDEFEPNTEMNCDGAILIGLLEIGGEMNGTINLSRIHRIGCSGTDCNQDGRISVLGAGVSSGDIYVNFAIYGGSISINQAGSEFSGELKTWELSTTTPYAGAPSISIRRLSGTVHVDRDSLTYHVVGYIDIEEDVTSSGLILLDSALGFENNGILVDSRILVGGDVDSGGAIKVLGYGLPDYYSRIEVTGSMAGLIQIGASASPFVEAPINGRVLIGTGGSGSMSGTLRHYGTIGKDSSAEQYGIVKVWGDLSGTYGQQTGTTGVNVGSLIVLDDCTGTLTMYGRLDGTSASVGTIDVAGDVSGAVTLHGGMKNAQVLLNSTAGVTSGTITVGSSSLEWEDISNVIALDLISMDDFHDDAELIFKGCFDTLPASYTFEEVCISGDDDGTITRNFCATATVTITESCP